MVQNDFLLLIFPAILVAALLLAVIALLFVVIPYICRYMCVFYIICKNPALIAFPSEPGSLKFFFFQEALYIKIYKDYLLPRPTAFRRECKLNAASDKYITLDFFLCQMRLYFD